MGQERDPEGQENELKYVGNRGKRNLQKVLEIQDKGHSLFSKWVILAELPDLGDMEPEKTTCQDP